MFAGLTLWEDKYRQLIRLSRQLTPLPVSLKQQRIAIAGCENRVWFGHQRLNDARFHFYADSDSRIVQGLLAVLLTAIEGKTARQLLAMDPLLLFDSLNLRRQLSVSRGQGLAALVRQVQDYANQ